MLLLELLTLLGGFGERPREASSRWMAASCWRRKNSFCCLERDSSTDAAIFLDTSDIEACLMNNSVASFSRSSGSAADKKAISSDA